MDIEKMREYVRLCETLNFTRTAKELFLSQSTLSKHILQVEDELGSQLILRSTHDVSLTAEGELVRERFAHIVDDYDACARDLAELRDGITGRLRVGFIYYGGMSYMREGLDRFFKSYPNVKVEFVSQQPHDTIAGLRSGELDAGLIPETTSLAREGLSFAPVYNSRLYAFVRTSGRFAGKQRLEASDLDGAAFVMLDADEDFNQAILDVLGSAGISVGKEVRCPQLDLFPRAVAESDAVFVGSSHMPVSPDEQVTILPIDNPELRLPVGLYHRPDVTNGALTAFASSW